MTTASRPEAPLSTAATDPPRRVDAPRWRSLSTRIVLLFLGLLLLVQAASFTAIRESIAGNARAQVAHELALAERVLQRLVAQSAERLLQAATLLAADYGFRAAVASADVETIDSALANHGERIHASVTALFDADFRPRSGGAGAAALQPVVARLAPLARAGEPASVVTAHEGRPYQFVLAPMRAPVVVGWVLMGFAVDAGLANDLRSLSAAHLALLTRDGPRDDWRAALSTYPGADAVAGLAPAAQAVELADGEHGLRRVALSRPDGAAEVAAVLLRSVDEAAAPYRELQWSLALLTLLGVGAFAIGAVFTARRVTTPLTQLVAAADRIGRGDYDTPPAGLARRDEIGGLARAFDAMRIAVDHHQREALRLAYWDDLTGLPNRVQFGRQVEQAIARAERDGGSLAVLMLDLDRFKHVNDVLGYAFGDALLKAVAERLRQDCVRDGDAVARLSGDEFAVLLPSADASLAHGVAERIERSFERPLSIDDHTVDLHAGIGVACWPHHAADAQSLLGRAEVAMYAAKRRGGGSLLYDPAFDSASSQTLSLLGDLRRALDHGELRLFLQPKLALQRDHVVGAEALVRWQHPQRGLVPPAEFIPFAEQTGFIRQLTVWVFERTAEAWLALQRHGLTLQMSVNLSTRDLLDQDLPGKLDALLLKHAVPAEAFCLEITESAIMDDPLRAQATLERLSRRGFKLAIDDFGTGYSSLAYLKRLPVDELKIDKSFVLAMERDLDDAKIVRSTIDLAHNLGLSVVAEGVENAAVMQQLRELACDEAQGYHLSRPMPAAELAGWCLKRSPAWPEARRTSDTGSMPLTLH